MSAPRRLRGARALAYFAAAAALLLVAARGQERHRIVGDFAVVIDKDPLTLDNNVTATVRRAGRMFGVRCLEGKMSMAVGSSLDGETVTPGESVEVHVQFDGRDGADLVGAALNENEVEIARADTLVAELRSANSVAITIRTNTRSYAYGLAVSGAGEAARRVRMACGQ